MTQPTTDPRKAALDEIWKIIAGWEPYEASNLGNIRHGVKKKNRRPHLDRYGYLKLCINVGEKAKTPKVHALCMIAFYGEQIGMVVNHKDKNRANNILENLEYVSVRENTTHGLQKINTGAIFNKRNNNWVSRARLDGKLYHLGTFETPELASNAYRNFLTENGVENKHAK